jgi:hypothetical protein
MAPAGATARWHQLAHGPQGHNRHDGHRGSHISSLLLPIPKQFKKPSAYFEKCLGNPVLRQLEKNTKVEKPLLVEAGRHG